ncbi:MAG: hypothetical protein AAGI22_12965 [Planctomycetota bacterium]
MTLAALLPLMTLAAPAAPAQQLTVLVREDDQLPGAGTLRFVDQLAVNDRGDWLVTADMELPNSTGFGDFALIGPNGVIIAPQTDLVGMPGVSADLYDAVGLTGEGDSVVICDLIGVPIGQRVALLVNGRVERREGFPVDAVGLPPSAAWTFFFLGPLVSARGRVVTFGDVEPTGSPPDQWAVVDHRIQGGTIVSAEAVLQEGDPLPMQTGTLRRANVRAISDGGHILYGATGGPNGEVLYLDDTLLAERGQPSVVPGRPWTNFIGTAKGDVNSSGQYVFVERIVGDSATEWVIVKDGALFRQSGDTLPAIAPFVIETFRTSLASLTDRPQITESGAVLWSATWDDPTPGRGRGVFLDDRLIIEPGVTMAGSEVVRGVDGRTMRISPNGRWLIFRGQVSAPGQLNDEAAILMDLGEGMPVCAPSVPNSTGASAEITALAPVVAAGSPLQLVAHDLPLQRTGYFLVAPQTGFVVQPGGSQGTLCLSGSIGRFIGQTMSTGTAGYLRATVDTSLLPLSPNRPVLAGETWTFQGWYRDDNPTPTSNFTSAVSVMF